MSLPEPYRLPVVPTFQDWTFPRDLPETWTRCRRIQDAGLNTISQSNLTAAIRERDVTCRITAFESGTEVALDPRTRKTMVSVKFYERMEFFLDAGSRKPSKRSR